MEGEDGSEIGQREELSCDGVPTQASATHRLVSAGESKRKQNLKRRPCLSLGAELLWN